MQREVRVDAEESFHAYVSGRLAAWSRWRTGDRHAAEDLA
jgi:hypothetical protein